MSRLFTSLIILISFFGFAQSPNFQWARAFGNTGDEWGRAVCTDASGNVYTTGYFSGTVDFDPGPATFTLSAVQQDVFISKLDASGNFVWAKSIGGSNWDEAWAIHVDANANVYVTGYYMSPTIDLDPGPGTFTVAAAGSQDAFILKLDASGNFVWAKRFGSVFSGGEGITTDTQGNVILLGYFTGTVDVDPGPNTYTVACSGPNSQFTLLLKLTSAGNFVTAKAFGGPSTTEARSMAFDNSGNVYLTGYFFSGADFDPGPATYSVSCASTGNAFICKLDNSWNFAWAFGLAGSGGDSGGIGVDSNGNVYAAGSFSQTSDFDPGAGTYTMASSGSLDGYLLKLSSGGNLIWAKQFGGAGIDAPLWLTMDNSDNVYMTGNFSLTCDFDPSPATYTMTSYGQRDVFISKMDASGNLVWAQQMGGTLPELGYGLFVDAAGSIYGTGRFDSPACDFDPGPSSYTLQAQGQYDVYVVKLSQAPTSLKEKNLEANFLMYPNPAKETITIEAGNEIKFVSVTDISGRIVFEMNNAGSNKVRIKAEGWSSGVYFVQMNGAGFQERLKFIKE